MKKLKIFLLISLLVCFGFALSSEVHASGPKLFEVNDVLPQGTVRISWVKSLGAPYEARIETVSDITLVSYFIDDIYSIIWVEDGTDIYKNGDFIPPYTDFGGGHAYYDLDTSNWSLNDRTVSFVDDDWEIFVWEEIEPIPSGYTISFNPNGGSSISSINDATELPTLPTPTRTGYNFQGWYYDSDFTNEAFAGDPLTGDIILYAKWSPTSASGPKPFEVNDVLPATTQLRISWIKSLETYDAFDIGTTYDSEFIYYLIDGADYDMISINGEYIYTYDDGFISPYTDVDGDHAYIVINTSSWSLDQRTISSVGRDGYFVWEDLNALSEEEIYQAGYSDGYQAARGYYGLYEGGNWFTAEQVINIGFESARELYGYYDSSTAEWLSVSEYIDRYGTVKMNQTDFYNNFDKYFIPAMIIVFGGAIVLTLLKVFKGRE